MSKEIAQLAYLSDPDTNLGQDLDGKDGASQVDQLSDPNREIHLLDGYHQPNQWQHLP